MNESKFLNNKKNNNNKFNKYLSVFITKILICCIIFVILLIITKANPKLKESISKQVNSNNFSFAKINKLYNKYFGSILPIDNILPNDDVMVFNEKITYSNSNLYKDGVKLSVTDKYLVPILESGIVVFIGEKDNYGKTVVIQQVNGIDVWYGNINITNIKLYDYVEKGSLLGETIDNKLYLVFQKDGEFLDYKKYL